MAVVVRSTSNFVGTQITSNLFLRGNQKNIGQYFHAGPIVGGIDKFMSNKRLILQIILDKRTFRKQLL